MPPGVGAAVRTTTVPGAAGRVTSAAGSTGRVTSAVGSTVPGRTAAGSSGRVTTAAGTGVRVEKVPTVRARSGAGSTGRVTTAQTGLVLGASAVRAPTALVVSGPPEDASVGIRALVARAARPAVDATA